MLRAPSREGMTMRILRAVPPKLARSAPDAAARKFCIAACLALWAAGAIAQPAAKEPTLSASASRYPAGTILTVEQAEQALADVMREHGEIEARFRAEEQECLPRFFATSCIEKAQERRRKATMELRSIEIEANVFKRRLRVEERDKALAERSKQTESERAERAGQHKEATVGPAGVDNASPSSASFDTEQRTPSINLDTGRKERHDARMARIRADEAAKAKERAENAVEYEQKVQASKARQEEVARRKAEKERKRVLKQTPGPVTQ